MTAFQSCIQLIAYVYIMHVDNSVDNVDFSLGQADFEFLHLFYIAISALLRADKAFAFLSIYWIFFWLRNKIYRKIGRIF